MRHEVQYNDNLSDWIRRKNKRNNEDKTSPCFANKNRRWIFGLMIFFF